MGMVGKTLKALGTGLDMSHASRMQRAQDMGFDTSKTYYHGTNAKNINAFDTGSAPGWGEGVYMTDNPEAASEFGDTVYPLFTRGDNTYRDEVLDWDKVENTKAWGEYKDKYDDPYDAWQEEGDFSGKALRELGYDGIMSDGSNGIAGIEGVIFNPNQIRSVNAAFDPAQKSSANLMAGVGGAAILGGSMLPQDAAASAGQSQGGAMQDVGNVALEVISGINQGVIDVADIPADILNAVFEIMDSEIRVPRLGDQPLIQQGTQGGYMEPGVGRQVARTLGEFGSPI